MATYINGVDRTKCIKKSSVNITNTIHSAIDSASLTINPGTIVIKGGEEVIITDDANSKRVPAFLFDGSTNFLLRSELLFQFPMTLETYVKPLNDNATAYLYGADVPDGIADGTHNETFLGQSASGKYRFFCRTEGVTHCDLLSPDPVDLEGRKVSAVLGDTCLLLVDGVVVASAPLVGAPDFSNYSLFLNLGKPGADTRYFPGYLSQVALWHGARSVAQIRSAYNRELLGFEPGLAAYWKCEETGGLVVLDSTASANDLVLNGTVEPSLRDTLNGPELFGVRLFAGHMTNPQEDGVKTDLGYAVQCRDYTPYLDHLLVVDGYETKRQPDGSYYDKTSPNTWTLGKIVRDLLAKFAPAGYFTTKGVIAEASDDDPIIDAASFSYVYLTEAFDELKKITGYDWYVDYYRDLRFFKAATNAAPVSLTDDTLTYNNLRFSVDRSQIRNRVYVKGGKQLSGPDGDIPVTSLPGTTASVYNLPHEPLELDAGFTVSRTAVGGDPQTYGVDPNSAYRIIALKVVNNPGGANDGHVIASLPVGVNSINSFFQADGVTRDVYDAMVQIDNIPFLKLYDPIDNTRRVELYNQYAVPILVYVDDQQSQELVKEIEGGSGVYEYILDEPDIINVEQARERAKAELRAYSQPVVTGSFDTHIPWFAGGQTVFIDVTRTNGNRMTGNFVVQSVSTKSDGVGYSYAVQFSKKLYDIEEFFRTILKKLNRVEIKKNEVLDTLFTVPETLKITEIVDVVLEEPKPAKWGSARYVNQLAVPIAALAAELSLATYNSNVTLDVGTGGLKLLPAAVTGELHTQWYDKTASGRTFKAFVPSATLPSGTQIRYYFRTSSEPTFQNPTRWKAILECGTDHNRYWQMKAVFESGQAGVTPVLTGYAMDFYMVDSAYVQYGRATYGS